jgi:hypothetical protein
MLYHLEMPVILRWNGYKFFFFSNEGDPLEPAHVHVRKAEALAKFWLKPKVGLAEGFGFSGKELRQLESVVLENQELFIGKWNEFFQL